MIRAETIQITPEILNLIAELDEFKGAWKALGSLAPDRLFAQPAPQRVRSTIVGWTTILSRPSALPGAASMF
jgi:hypothetical protein